MEVFRLIQGQLSNNVFIIKKDNTDILVDPGLDKNKIELWLKENNFRPQFILLTHGHFDHIASAKYFQNKYKCDIYVGSEDQYYLDDPFGPLNFDGSLFGKIKTNFKYIPTINGDTKIGDIEVLILKTPGHTPGSTCYYLKEINTVFTGDTLFKKNIGRTDFHKGCSKTILKSIKNKLFSLPKDCKVWPGHGPSSTINYETKNNPYLKGK